MAGQNDTTVHLVEQAVSDLESDAKQGRYAPMPTKFAGSVAQLLGREDIALRCSKLLGDAPDSAFWYGVLTNIVLPEAVPPQMRSIPTLAELEEAFPPYSESRVSPTFSNLPNLNSTSPWHLSGGTRRLSTTRSPMCRFRRLR